MMSNEWDVADETSLNADEWSVVTETPAYKGRPGVQAALLDILKQRRGRPEPSALSRMSDRAAEAFTLGLTRQSNAAIGAAITAAQRALPGGKQPTYTARDRYDAERLLAEAEQKAFAAKKPVTAFTADVLGALAMPGGKQVGKWIVGKTAPKLAASGTKVPLATRAAQTGRAAVAGGALTGAQAGLTAAPGQESERAQSGALTGAILAPVTGLVAGGVGMAAPSVGRTAQRVVGALPESRVTTPLKKLVGPAPTAAIKSVEKLQRVLRDAGVTPDAIRQAATEWREMGGVTPATIDIIRDAGGTPEVMRLLSRSTARAPQRRIAEQYAGETVAGADVAKDIAVRDPSAVGMPREKGAEVFSKELNKLYDASEKAYKSAYEVAEKAAPEAAIIDETEVRPLFEKLKIPQNFDEALPGVAAVKSYIGKKKGAIAPGDPADWPEGETMELAAPLSVLEMQKMRQVLTHYASKYADEPGGALAARFKQTLDDELQRLSAENKIAGDPEIVDKWRQAIEGYAAHQQKFGSGAAAALTRRKPSGEPEVEASRAGDVLFGASPSPVSLNKTLSDLGETLDLVSPESTRALQEELYGRVKPEDIVALRETTGGKRLLPEDLAADVVLPERLEAVGKRGETAQALKRATLDNVSDEPVVTAPELAYRSGKYEWLLRLLNNRNLLNEKEYNEALRTLTSQDPAATERLLQGLLKKYPAVKRAISPALVRPAAGEGDVGAMETLEEDYGLTPQ